MLLILSEWCSIRNELIKIVVLHGKVHFEKREVSLHCWAVPVINCMEKVHLQ